ncbi:arylsulfatase [Ilumatobacter sp.]|uniref:arylsulfatase n=1 Tax=Ilumatobacter sp. TaxID=1967498 RepID=UPI003AF6F3D2
MIDQPPDVLPRGRSPFRGEIAETYREATPDWPDAVRPPEKAPNIVVIMFDDLGFGQLSAFGGPIDAPHIGELAAAGLRYTNFHTTALCSPSRAALLTGRNHHSVGFATIAEMATGFPGYDSFLPKSAATIAEVLRLNGYSTYCTGKWHLTPTAEATAAGPFDHWPLGMGFERFYGFLPGETDQWHPILTSDNHRITTPDRDGYHLSEDLIDQAIGMIRDQQQVSSGRPFFTYVPFGAVHCPFHAPAEHIERYRGRFDRGWDVVRRETFERQQELGIVPAGNELPPRNPGVKPWDELSDDARKLHARQMEVFAGMVDHTDAQIGRLMAALADLGVLDDTIVMVLSDNGASQEGMLHGATNTERFRNLVPESVEEQLPFIDELGGPTTDPHYPIGWAMAGNAPFRRCKRDTHRGGNTDPLVVHWPAGIDDPGALRTQYHHIVDVYPTLLELAGLPVPQVVNGIRQQEIEGHSFAPTIADGAAPDVKTTQYYEMLGSRAIYHEGWMAVTWHRPGTDWNDDRWELYDQRTDYTQAWDLADELPDRLAELIGLWWDEARRHQVLPLDDRGRDRFIDPTRPAASEIRDVYRYHSGSSPIPNPSLPIILNCPHSFTVSFRLDDPDDHGLLVSQGGSLAGWALIVRDRRVTYLNNNLKLSLAELSTDELPVGRDLAVRYEWHPSAPGVGDVRLFVDDEIVASLDDVRSAPRGYSMVQEGLSVGRAWGPPVDADAYHGAFEFTGTLHIVEMRTDRSRQVQPTDRG